MRRVAKPEFENREAELPAKHRQNRNYVCVSQLTGNVSAWLVARHVRQRTDHVVFLAHSLSA